MHTSLRGLIAATLLVGTAFAATPALADDAPASPFTITGSAAVASQYRFRGLAQSDNKPVVQGAITLAHSSGFYISTWGSSATGNDVVNIGGTEIDVYGGWTHALGKSGVTFDGGVYGYIYPGFTPGNYYEIYGSLAKTFGPFSAKAGAYYAPGQKVFDLNFTSPSRKNLYVYGELGAGIPNTPLSVHSHLGHTGGGFDYGKQYLDWNVGVTLKWKALAFDASWVGTNVSRGDINKGFGLEGDASEVGRFYRIAKDVAVLSVTASF